MNVGMKKICLSIVCVCGVVAEVEHTKSATTHGFPTPLSNTMKLTALTLLSTLAVAAGFAPGFVGRHASLLFADLKTGTVKW